MISGPIVLLVFLGWILKGILSDDEDDIQTGKEAASGIGCALAAGFGGSILLVIMILASV